MTTACIINDFTQDRRTFLLFTEAEFKRVNAFWECSDKLLADLQSHELFAGRLRWCDLEPYHFGFLIMKNLAYCAELSNEQRGDEKHPVVKSLHFLLMCLIRSIENRAQCVVEMLHVNRVGEIDVSYNYTAALNMTLGAPKNNHLRVVIDNTRDDDES